MGGWGWIGIRVGGWSQFKGRVGKVGIGRVGEVG